jgi:hypothetical protein
MMQSKSEIYICAIALNRLYNVEATAGIQNNTCRLQRGLKIAGVGYSGDHTIVCLVFSQNDINLKHRCCRLQGGILKKSHREDESKVEILLASIPGPSPDGVRPRKIIK